MLEDISFDCLFDDFASDSGCSDADLLGATSSADSSSVTSLEASQQIVALGVASGQKRNCTEFDFGYVSDLSSQGQGNAHKKTKSVDSNSSANGEEQSTNDDLKKEHRLIRNRESANKCRQKKKTEMQNLNSKISELMGKIMSLTQENAGLRADNISLTDHNQFLRNLLASKLELPLHEAPATTTNPQTKTKSTTGIAMLGLFGAVAIVKNVCSSSVSDSYVGGRILLSDHSTHDIEHGNSLYLAVVGVFACLILLFSLQFFQEQKPDKKTYLP